MINAKHTAKLVAEKFGREDGFDTSYFLHLVTLYLRNDRCMYETLRSLDFADARGVVNLARDVIYCVIKWDVCGGESPSSAGIRMATPSRLWLDVVNYVLRPDDE